MTNAEFDRAIEAIRQGHISRQSWRAAEAEEAQRAGSGPRSYVFSAAQPSHGP